MAGPVSQSKYKGVRKRRPSGKWTSEIHDPIRKKQLWIGSFDTSVEAATAYDMVAYYFKGSNARLNFPASLHTHLPSLFPANPTMEEICHLARCSSVAAVSESSRASTSGVMDDFGLVDEEIGNNNNSPVTIIGHSGVIPPVAATVTLSPSEIESLREMPLYSQLHQSSWGDSDFELHGTQF